MRKGIKRHYGRIPKYFTPWQEGLPPTPPPTLIREESLIDLWAHYGIWRKRYPTEKDLVTAGMAGKIEGFMIYRETKAEQHR